MSVPNNTDNEWLIHRELSDDLHLRKQRHALLALLEADEQVVAVAAEINRAGSHEFQTPPFMTEGAL